MENLIIRNAKAVLPNGIQSGVSVRIINGVIAAVEPDGMDDCGHAVLDAAGLYLTPGFIDLHTHGRCFADAMDANRDSLARIAKDLLCHGVTGFLITTQAASLAHTRKAIEAAVRYIHDPDPDGAVPLGIYLEGPFLSGAKKGAQQLENADSIDLAALCGLLDAGDGHIRVVALAPELPGALSAIERIIAYNAVAAAAHTNCRYNEATAAIDAGITLATHCFNAMRPLDHREPSVLGACLTDARVTCEAIVDGVHLHPAIVKILYLTKDIDRLALISDSVAAAGVPDGEYEYAGRKFTVDGGAIRLPDGTLAGSALSLDAAVRNMMAFTGCPLYKAVATASFTPARVIGIGGQRGSIEAGKAADLLLLDDNIRIRSVFVGGKRRAL